MKDRFKHAEDEYVRLKELNASGQLTQEQFDVLLKKLMVQDAQGRWLMIGADSGKWYVQEGGQWVEADTSATQLTTPMRPSSKLPVIVIGALAFVLLALGGIFVAASPGLVNIGGISKAPTFVAVITITPAATATALPTAAASLPTSPAASPTVMQMAGMDNSTPAGTLQSGIASQSVGLLRFADATGIADQVVLSLAKIPPPASGNRYEAWLVGEQGEARLSLGKVNIDAKGSGQLTFVDKDGQNLLARFDRFELTLEPEPDPSPLPSGIVLYSSAVPPGALMHIQHLLVAFDDTPDPPIINQSSKK